MIEASHVLIELFLRLQEVSTISEEKSILRGYYRAT